ncbi:MAG: AAA family ATPase [Cyanobacteriota bacterium]|nr:AAA family ATPase [Cyanobacteriota bacterium]
MTPEEAFEFIDRIYIEKNSQSLNDNEKQVIYGVWEGKTYQDIADEIHLTHQSIKDIGNNLNKQLSQMLTRNIKKRNFKTTIEQLFYQYKEQTLNSVPSSELPNLISPKNPFYPLNGAIDNEHLFFNRQPTMQRVFELLQSGSSVAIIGECQVGKSSLLKAISRQSDRLNQLQRQPIYLDLQPVENEEDFYCYLCDEIGIADCRGFQLKRALKNRRLLLLLDEVDKIAGNGFTHNVRDWLRGMASQGSNTPLRLIVAARESLDTLFGEGKTSPLANICIEERLEVWDEATARLFVETRLEPTAIRFSEAEIAEVIAESGGHPQKLMYSCYKLYRHKETG